MADANHQVAFSALRPASRFRLHANLPREADKRLERRASSRVASVPAEDSWVPDGPAVDWGRWPLVEACWMRWSRSCSRSEQVRRRSSGACLGSAQELDRASCDTCLGEELAAIGGYVRSAAEQYNGVEPCRQRVPGSPTYSGSEMVPPLPRRDTDGPRGYSRSSLSLPAHALLVVLHLIFRRSCHRSVM